MLKGALRNILAQALAFGVSAFDRIVVVGALVRSFGVDQYADWVSIVSAAGLFSVAETGLNFYFGNLLQRDFARGDTAAFRRGFGVALAASLALCAILLPLAGLLAAHLDLVAALHLRVLGAGPAAFCFALCALLGVLKILRGAVSQLYRATGEFAQGTTIDAVNVGAMAVAAALTALAGGAPTTLALVLLIVDLISGWGLTLFDLTRRHPELRFRPAAPTRREFADAASRIRWAAATQASVTLLLWAPPLLLGGAASGGRAVVAFVLMRTLVNLARQATGMVLLAVNVELVAGVHARGGGEAGGRLHALGVFTLAVVGVMAAGLLLFAEPALALWTGRAGLFDRAALLWLLAGAVAGALVAPTQMLLSFLNEPRSVALAALANAAVGLAGAAAFAPAYGAAGAACGLAFGEAAAAVLFLSLRAPGELAQGRGRRAARALGAGGLAALWCAAVGAFAETLLPGGGPAPFLLRAFVFVTAGAAPALCAALPAATRARLISAARAQRR